MVFLRKVRTASGATAVQIAVRRDRRDVVVEHLGSAHTEAELAALMEAGRAKIHAGQGELGLTPSGGHRLCGFSSRGGELVFVSRVKISGRTVESVLKENLNYG